MKINQSESRERNNNQPREKELTNTKCEQSKQVSNGANYTIIPIIELSRQKSHSNSKYNSKSTENSAMEKKINGIEVETIVKIREHSPETFKTQQ